MKKISLNNFYDWPLALRMLVLSLLAVIVFYFCYSWDISKMNTKLMNVRLQEKNLKDQLQLVISNQHSLKKETSQSEQLRNILSQWQNKLPTYPALPDLINQILKIGSTSGVQFPLFQPESVVKEDIYYKVPIKVVVVGNYHQIASFISQVANLPWIVAINNFTITSEIKNDVIGVKLAQKAASENLLTANFNFEVYYLADKNAQPKS